MSLPPSNPYHRHRTAWCVVTGAPCSGKTAVIRELAGRGFRVEPEAARAYIDRRLARGETLAAIKADNLAFERHILMAKVAVEKRLPADTLIFMDRAVPDSIAYYRIEGLDPAEAIHHGRRAGYRSIFLLERLAFRTDRVRSESDATAERIESLLVEAYEALGYPIVRVPLMGISKRADFILRHVAGA
jgi:predicted ATPase